MASRAGLLGALLLIFLFWVVIAVMFVLYAAGAFAGGGGFDLAHVVGASWLPAFG